MNKIKQSDFAAYLLVMTIIFMGVLFIYLNTVSIKHAQYEKNNEDIYQLKILNNKFDNFVLSESGFKNYDEIVKDVKEFSFYLKKIEKNLPYTDLNLSDIKECFLKKKSVIERYKSKKAMIFYTMSYTIELQESLKKEYEQESLHELMNFSISSLFKLYINYDTDKKKINENIDKLKEYNKSLASNRLSVFILHVENLNENISFMNEQKSIYKRIELYRGLDDYKTSFMMMFKKSIETKNMIYNTMFIFVILLLIVLFMMHIRSYKLRKDLISFRYAVENGDDSVVITDKDRHIIYVNEAFTNVTGYSKEEALGKNPSVLKSGKMPQEFYNNMNDVLNRGEKWSGEFINKTKDEKIYYEKASITPMFLNNELSGYLAIKLNITDYVKEKAKVEFLAYHDALTKLPNRRMMKDIIQKRIKEAKQHALQVDLLFLDLDGFKSINDSLGHNVGDMFLQEISKRLKEYLGDEEKLFRTGGDEFAIVLSYKGGISYSESVAMKIIQIVNEPVFIEESKLTVGISIGIARFNENSDDFISLLRHADIAMYEAKQTGRNRFCNYTKDLSKEVHKKMNVKQELLNSMKNGEFYVVYQPKYRLDTKEIVAVEALVRWENKNLGLVPPNYFIPIAEDLSIIHDIGLFVFKTACQDFKRLQKSISTLKSVSINLSPAQLNNHTLLDAFKEIVKSMDIKPQNIGLEITETHLMTDAVSAVKILEEMKNFGFRILLDDFGKGYSSMSYLKRLPISFIKIDKLFVDDICKDENDVKIVKAMVSITKSFEYTSIAEGIETKEQEDILRDLGVDMGQGYYFSKPKKVEELV